MVSLEKRTCNGRGAWGDLLLHFEGISYNERLSQEAATILKVTTYSVPKHNFSFGDYYKRNALAYTILDSAEKPMTTEQKIDSFVQGIQCFTAQNIVVNIADLPTDRTSFDVY